MSLTDLYNEMTTIDKQMEKEAEEMYKISAEEEAAGRFVARGFIDEINKLAQQMPRTPTMMVPPPKGPPQNPVKKHVQKAKEAKKLQETFKAKKVSPRAAAKLNEAARARVKHAVKAHDLKRSKLGYGIKQKGQVLGDALRETVGGYGKATARAGQSIKDVLKGYGKVMRGEG